MTTRRHVLLAALLLLGSPSAARSGDIAVVVTGIPSDKGTVRLAVCDRETFLGTCAMNRTVPARAGSVSIALGGVPSGRVAVLVHHDENDDGRLDTNLFGVPTEPIGFSNDPSTRWGPPRFEESAIDVTDAPLMLRITLNR